MSAIACLAFAVICWQAKAFLLANFFGSRGARGVGVGPDFTCDTGDAGGKGVGPPLGLLEPADSLGLASSVGGSFSFQLSSKSSATLRDPRQQSVPMKAIAARRPTTRTVRSQTLIESSSPHRSQSGRGQSTT